MRSRKQTHKIDLEVVEHTGKGFQVVKHRWKVERTLAWLLNDRCHSRDYEVLTANTHVQGGVARGSEFCSVAPP